MTPWVRTNRAGTFAEYKRVLEALFRLSGGRSCLDLGCGEAHVTRNFPHVLLVDLVPRLNPVAPVASWDMRDAPAKIAGKENFDMGLLADSLEHLGRGDGEKLLQDLRPHCRALVIFTPVGPWHLDRAATHPDAHKSAWHPEEFAAWGWEVWEWPSYHRYEDGEILGAFWAWQFLSVNPPTREVAESACVPL